MAIREIRKKGDPILSKKCKPVTKFDDRLHMLLDDMHDTLATFEGVGLAAPQVGILKRVFICEYDGFSVEAINPEIISQSGEQTGTEGCLSIPGEWYEVTRPSKVTLKAQDRYGNEFTMDGEELIARCFCHETDHLDGILFIEKITEDEKVRKFEEEPDGEDEELSEIIEELTED